MIIPMSAVNRENSSTNQEQLTVSAFYCLYVSARTSIRWKKPGLKDEERLGKPGTYRFPGQAL